MGLQELDTHLLNGRVFKDWLSPISLPVVILVWSKNFNKIKCQTALQMIKEISQKPEFCDNVVFLQLDADECNDLCEALSAWRVPLILIYKNRKELFRFQDGINAGTIIQRLHIITDPVRNPHKTE